MDNEPPVIDVDLAEVQAALDRIKTGRGTPDDFELIERLIRSYVDLTQLLRQRGTTIARLRRLFGLAGSERTADVLGRRDQPGTPSGGVDPSGPTPAADTPQAPAPSSAPAPEAARAEAGPAATERAQPKRKGHGRRPWSDYAGAPCLPVLHAVLRMGQSCPLCGRGKLYDTKRPAPIVRIVGQPPLAAKCWLCQTLRCSTCGHLFTAPAPKEAQGPKYDETATGMIGLLRYGLGLPHHRLARLQANLQTPTPPATLWEVTHAAVGVLRPVFDELRRQAAQSQLLHNDDSYVRILEFMGKRRAQLLAQGALPAPDRTGLFTTAIVAYTDEDRRIALFFSGRQHAGENLGDLLQQRAPSLNPPVLMSDALDRNVPKGPPVVEANCLAHGRRHICDEVANFPAECAYLLTALGRVFRVDGLCRFYQLTEAARLHVHQKWSGPVLAELHRWVTAQLDERRIEPNSDMGKALKYLTRHWDKLTLFLRRPGVPLDNNLCERVLKLAIQHRKNSLFFKTAHGAEVGDLYMSLIETAVLNDENAFAYLTELLRHGAAVAADAAAWLPWTYRATLAALGTQPTATAPPRAPGGTADRAPNGDPRLPWIPPPSVLPAESPNARSPPH